MKKYPTHNKKLINWVDKMTRLCEPQDIVWIDGSEEQKLRLQEESVLSGELIRLNQKKLPGCFLHRTSIDDVARTEHLTFICTKRKRTAGPTSNWMPPKLAYKKAEAIFKGSMRWRTMYVIPFSMGPVGSEFSKIGVELTDSRYVVLNMLIMTRVGEAVLRHLEDKDDFTKCLHSKADLDINKRMILHFPEDNTIWSVGSGYGGNVLLGKKCLSLRIASVIARREMWLAEHMLIMGIEEPNGHIEYIAAAFPSACGKTNLAMLIPPQGLRRKGYRIWTVGDDIAWMRIDSDGALWAINPESGFFGVAPGTNSRTNPNMVETIKKDTIFTNVLLKPDGTVWWEGADGEIPAEGIDWQGRPWRPGMFDASGRPILGAHPNSRFTTPIENCPSVSFRLEQHHGVPISAIVFGGRRQHLAPLVYESFNWQHGVFLGATMASERTAAQVGKLGEVRRDPMAMFPFCGYNMAEYFKHWLKMGKNMPKAPKIFHVNWFRIDENGKFLWPGFGENLRVLEWILDRCNNKISAVQTPVGYIPKISDIDITGLKLSKNSLQKLFEIHKKDWMVELESIKTFFKKFKNSLPRELWQEYKALYSRIKNYKG
ncbi:MAG: phosphoenolpyruvate carboxykinase (GTP) [Candidatus Omnitrophica bacterium CG11_big_fil_rev_8_21_14_0_20_42_13]|uniref:Phosphoenolpyruvate carboxykinase [GTP] n=1 Tax=Candidatus Ghiorseimicrobium undicola TaxID=1974746 RepID=A0A2H0LV89_9BACT|nr:MAG: phosphoenolpyruvate carboxykinase (GTP) [Candidatus Omnitrophica bacterium CG11_big_fil_rev_8_21_14_0_20_42_13]